MRGQLVKWKYKFVIFYHSTSLSLIVIYQTFSFQLRIMANGTIETRPIAKNIVDHKLPPLTARMGASSTAHIPVDRLPANLTLATLQVVPGDLLKRPSRLAQRASEWTSTSSSTPTEGWSGKTLKITNSL